MTHQKIGMINCFNLVTDHMVSIYVLRVRDVCRLQTAYSKFSLQGRARSLLRNWLVNEEAGRGSRQIDIRYLEFEYHTAKLLRITLRRVQNLQTPVVIAGSYPALVYAEQQGWAHEKPNESTFGYSMKPL